MFSSPQWPSRYNDFALAIALFSFFRALGQSIDVAVGAYLSDASALVQIIKAIPHGPVKTQFIQSYADDLKLV